MIENELIEIKSLQINLNDDNSVKMFVNALNEIKDKGYDKLKIEIKVSIEQELIKSDLNIEVFNKIKNMQELPDWVIVNLMLAAGKLQESKFKVKLLNE